jgi:CheY-like chemotaxis protein
MKTKSFLIVDDISAMRAVTKSLLVNLGVENIHQASHGVDALKILGRERIDVVLSDWNMPIMDGMALLKAMRAEPRLRQLPFILITAEADRERVKQAIEAGVAGVLVKPYSGTSLAQRVQRVLTQGSVAEEPDKPDNPAAKTVGATLPDKASILIVDDTPDNLEMLSGILKDDFKVRVANSGKRALSLCQSENAPDLVLLDIMMPEMDGFEVAQRLREHPTSAQIPVIFVTAMTDDAARARGMELGAVDFVTKPIDPDGLKIRIQNFMRYVDLRRQLQADYDGMMENAKLKESVEAITKHDIKGPLAAVLGLAQELAASSELSNALKAKAKHIEEATLGVLDTITRSTELYRIEAGAFEFKPQKVSLPVLIRQQADLIGVGFAAKGLSFNISIANGSDEEPVVISGDPMLCRSVFQNLIKNACEAAPDNSTIAIAIYSGAPVRVVIANAGAVPAAVRDNFFDKFATSGKERGSGLGTYSAKLMVEAQRGTIAMKSDDAKNSTEITLTFVAPE